MSELGFAADSLEVIPNGFDLAAFPSRDEAVTSDIRAEQSAAPEAKLLISVGRVDRQKGPDILVEALHDLNTRRPDLPWHCLFVGAALHDEQKQLRDDLIARLKSYGLADQFQFLGERSDIASLLYQSDLMVMTCRREGFFPIAAQEACAASCPVAITDYGEAFPAFVDGETGWYLPLEDPAGVSRTLESILTLPDAKRDAVGDHGRTYIEQFFSLAQRQQAFVDLVSRVTS